jgi:hypothetical protein
VGDALRRAGIRAVLTGGACASVHTRGLYSSVDADFVLLSDIERERLDETLGTLGFRRAGDRYVHPDSDIYIEFPRGPLAIGGDDRIHPVEHVAGKRRCLALSPTDSCRDRLAAYFHWGDRQSLDVAVQIATRNRLSWKVIRKWSESEGHLVGYEEFLTAVRRGRR